MWKSRICIVKQFVEIFQVELVNFLFCFSVGFPVLILFVSVKPYQRGFYCDDESLMHPYKTNTIPTWVAGFVGIVLPSLSVCIQII